MIDFKGLNTLYGVSQYFNSEYVCRQAIAESRWADGDIICPYCGEHHCVRRSDGKYRCNKCERNFSVTVGTIFENTKVPLTKWFLAMYLISSHKKGISSYQLSRDIKVTQKTAWYMLQKIRTLFRQDETKFAGDIELDEVYIGGREKWKHLRKRTPNTQGRSTKTKTPVFGMMERMEYTDSKGNVSTMSLARAIVVPATDGKTLLPIVERYIEKGSRITTDELTSYKGLSGMGYEHGIVCHGANEFVKGKLYTNNMEGFWSHFKRMIVGCYHDVSDKYLQRYVDEVVYRWNTRKMDESIRFVHMFEMSIGIVSYADVRVCKAI